MDNTVTFLPFVVLFSRLPTCWSHSWSMVYSMWNSWSVIPRARNVLAGGHVVMLLFRATLLCISQCLLHREFRYTSLTVTSAMNSIEQTSVRLCSGYVCSFSCRMRHARCVLNNFLSRVKTEDSTVQFVDGTRLHDVGHRLSVTSCTQLGWWQVPLLQTGCTATLVCSEPVESAPLCTW